MLEVDGLHRRFGDIVALDDVSFDVRPGQVFGFLGPNGAGKTTTMRAIMGVTAPDAGEVRWKGAAIDDAVRLTFGYMPEERGLYPRMRVLDQLVFLARLHGLDAARAHANAAAWLERLGLAERAKDRLQHLSHGNQQRVQLAAAFVHEPDLLVLDEPFSGLDPVAVDVLAALLAEEAAGGRTIVFSSHQLDLVEDLCKAVAVLHRGRVVLTGDVRELRRSALASRRLRVAVPGSSMSWVTGLEGVHIVTQDDHAATIELHAGVDPAGVLIAAQRAGPVEEFCFDLPHLSDVFRAAVSL